MSPRATQWGVNITSMGRSLVEWRWRCRCGGEKLAQWNASQHLVALKKIHKFIEVQFTWAWEDWTGLELGDLPAS